MNGHFPLMLYELFLQALNPCSRLTKVFKAAGSVSYRRLLPFLMDAAKNDPGKSCFPKSLGTYIRCI